MKKILHFASHAINIGDGAIHEGTRAMFGAVFEEPLQFLNLDVVEFDLRRQLLAAKDLNATEVDAVMVGGGGSIDGYKNKPCGIAFPYFLSEVEKIEKPMLFWALGHNLFRGQIGEKEAKENLNALLRICRSRNWPFTVRADGSLERLEGVLTARNHQYVKELPDPGFFIPTDEDFDPPVFDRGYIIINIAYDNITVRLLGQEGGEDFLKSIANYISWAYKKGYGIVIAIHTTTDMMGTGWLLRSVDNEAARLGVQSTGMWDLGHAKKFFRYYQNASLVVGQRGHSVICGTGLGVPTIAIDTHDKVRGFMKEIGQLDNCINPNDPDFLATLKDTTSKILFKHDYDFGPIVLKRTQWQNDAVEFLREYQKSL